MSRPQKPLVCSKCDIEFDGECQELSKWYDCGDGMYCEECFKDWVKDYLDSNPEDIAALMHVPVWDVR